MGYVTFSLGCYMVCCSVTSLAVGYIYLSCSHLYSFASYDRPYALKIMSDVEDVTPANTDFPSSDVLLSSLPKQPLSQNLEASVPFQSSESSDIASAFSLFKDYFDKKLGALKRDIQDESCSNTDSVAKKLKEESKITFRFEGNKKQFQFNSDLAEKVKSASVALGKRKLDLVKTQLEELDSDIKKRNKLIRLADKSAAGWDLVNEYLSDELASGSEDEKRIRRAEQRALRKRSQRQQKAKLSKQGYSQPQSSTTTTAFADQHSSSSRPISRTFGAFRKPRPSDICFACGQQGHWRSQCQVNPQTRSSSSGQSFPSSSGFSGIGGK